MRLLVISIVVAIILPVLVSAEEERPRCENCGMYFDVSPSRVEITIELKKKKFTHIFECLNCAYNALTGQYGENLDITAVQMLDYQTFGKENEAMTDGLKATFLFGVERLKFTMPPFIVAYASKGEAEAAQKVLGGELVSSFEDVWKRLEKHNAPEEEETGHEGHGH